MVRTTHLEMVSPEQWVRRGRADLDIEVRECVVKQPRLNRFLYEYVGGDWGWTDRLVWPDEKYHRLTGRLPLTIRTAGAASG